jgi:hypothetical protein
MALFTERVDRFFFGKLFTGLFCISSALEAFRALVLFSGASALYYLLASAIWLILFLIIESLRKRAAKAKGVGR